MAVTVGHQFRLAFLVAAYNDSGVIDAVLYRIRGVLVGAVDRAG